LNSAHTDNSFHGPNMYMILHRLMPTSSPANWTHLCADFYNSILLRSCELWPTPSTEKWTHNHRRTHFFNSNNLRFCYTISQWGWILLVAERSGQCLRWADKFYVVDTIIIVSGRLQRGYAFAPLVLTSNCQWQALQHDRALLHDEKIVMVIVINGLPMNNLN
jgi:hypothetical protein